MTASRSLHWSQSIRASPPRRATGTQPAVLLSEDPVGPRGQLPVVGHHHHRGLELPRQRGEQLVQPLAVGVVQVARRLVGQDDAGS